MHNLALTWQQAALLAGALLVTALGLHQGAVPRLRGLSPFAREAGVIAGLYALWQLAGTLSVLGTTGAFQRADWIERTERNWRLPSEASVQRLVSGHPLIVQASNIYYATMHFGALFAFLVWLFVRHRDCYPGLRMTLALSTLVCLLVQLFPVAPPRLLPGYVDTAQQYGQSVYNLGLAPDELSAMPSVHVAWAVLVGCAVVRVSTSNWRWLALAHPVLTVFVITATANHFWLDGVVAIAILAACVVVQRAATQAVRAWRDRGDPALDVSAEPGQPILR
ncbi:MAG: phosphatase PAP2 family protein [Actinomycetota bacterium]|nr:phosphatase PAP2 family protein [Actinomycetota bacterium]